MSKIILIIPILFFCFVASAQNSYQEAIQQGDRALKNKDFDTAVEKYLAAAAFDTEKRAETQSKIEEVFHAISKLKQKAINERDEKAKALAEAKEAYASNQKLLDALYFYDGKFSLTYNKRTRKFSFINKNAEPAIKKKTDKGYVPHEFDEATPFDYHTGYAKVKIPQGVYLLDTSSNLYPLTTSKIKEQFTYGNLKAIDLRDQNLKLDDLYPIFQSPHVKDYEILILGNNMNIKHLPDQVGNLSNLKMFYSISNSWETLPDNLTKLKKLETLCLNNTNLKELPATFGQLDKVQHLELIQNNLTTLPEDIGGMEKLKILILATNKLTELPKSFGQLKNLEVLILNGNKLNAFPESILALKKLKILSLLGNNISQLPKDITQLKNLEKLILSKKGFSEEEQAEIKAWFPKKVVKWK